MDFQNILSLAAQNSNQKQIQKKFSTQLAPPKKEKREKEVKSEVVRKFIEEKEREKREAEEARERIKRKIQEAQDRKKREKELKLKREKEEEERKRKEEEKRNRFKIPKKGESTSTSDKNESKSSISSSSSPSLSSSSKVNSSSSKVKKESSDRKTSVGKNSESKKHETVSKKPQSKEGRHSDTVSDKVRSSKSEVVDPTTVKPTAISSHNRSSHLYDGIEKKVVKNETDIERKRREFEEKRARLIQQMRAKDTDSEKQVVSRKAEKTKSNKDSDKKSENLKKKSKNDKPAEQEKIAEKIGLPSSKPGATSERQDSRKPSLNEKIKSHNSGKKMPPPMGFSDLLKLAQVKSSEPVTIEKQKKPVDRKEPERLMTKEERERFMEEQAHKQRRLLNGKPSAVGTVTEKPLNKKENDHRNSKHSKEKNSMDYKEDHNSPKLKNLLTNGVKGSPGATSERTPIKRKSEMYSNSKSSSDVISKSTPSSAFNRPTDHSDAKRRRLEGAPMSKGDRSSPSMGKSVNRPNGQSKNRLNDQSGNRPSGQSMSRPTGQSGNRPSGQSMSRPTGQSGSRPDSQSSRPAQKRKAYDSENENVLVCGPPKPEPDLNPFDRIYQQIKKKNPKPEMKKRRIESDDEDSEYDEEMEGFITDEGSDIEDYAQDMDYSQHIRQIFGYDKRKYRYESDREIANMESNFAQQMKEEARSARLGLQEDLEDIRREEEELRRKMEKKKR